jgi:hypothetical protein
LTLQFQSISVNPDQPLSNVMGGTQDNGTFEWTSSVHIWDQVMYGDGGVSGYDPTDTRIRFNTFAGSDTDTNFRGGQPQSWVVSGGPLHAPHNGFELEPFYMAVLQDPVVAGHRFAGEGHVWRTDDNGGPQDYLEANCPEFTTPADAPQCGDYQPLGGPRGPNQPGDLTGGAYGADRTVVVPGLAVSVVSFLARCRGDENTMWAGTDLGRVFISRNVNAPHASVVWSRVDAGIPNAPGRYVSGIAVDPKSCNRAWISYSGYNANTPGAPGHVFEVTANPVGTGGVWRDLNIEAATAGMAAPSLDIPATDVVRDDLTGDLYASTDFGVLKNPGVPASGGGFTNAAGTWAPAGAGMPFVEVPSLTILPEARVLYAGTHGRGAYRMLVPGKRVDDSSTPGQGAP